MNIYRQHFRAECPVNGNWIDYQLTIETDALILVESLRDIVKALKGYHEDMADELYRRFGGVQRITAHHHGTDIETVRP